MQQERLCGFNSLIEQVAPNGNTKRPFECAHETTRREPTLFCKIGKRQITIQMFVQHLDRSILLPDRQPPGNNLRLAAALVCAAQMSAEHHDHFVDNQAWKLKRTIRERQHHPGPMKNHVIPGSRGAMQVANAFLLVLVTESVDNGPGYIDVNRVET